MIKDEEYLHIEAVDIFIKEVKKYFSQNKNIERMKLEIRGNKVYKFKLLDRFGKNIRGEGKKYFSSVGNLRYESMAEEYGGKIIEGISFLYDMDRKIINDKNFYKEFVSDNLGFRIEKEFNFLKLSKELLVSSEKKIRKLKV